MIRCRTCVMPSTRPDTAFVDGECSACIAYRQRPTIDWAARKAELVALLEKHRWRQHSRAPYDCIVPSSGGKDSSYQVLTLLELGAKPLIVTASTCMLTDVGRHNIDNLARYADTLEVTPNRTQRAKLNRLGLEMVGDISWPEHAAIFSVPFRIALAMDIPLIFYGENPQNQYGGPPGTEEARTMTQRWVSELGGFNGLRPRDLEPMAGNMGYYRAPTADDIEAAHVEAHFLGQYLPWDSHHNASVARAAGFQEYLANESLPDANWWSHENLDNAQTGLHDHAMYRKFGYGRGCAQISVDVRAGRIERAHALEWLQQNDGAFPFEYMGVRLEAVLEHIGMDREHLLETLDSFTNWDLFKGVSGLRPLLKAWA